MLGQRPILLGQGVVPVSYVLILLAASVLVPEAIGLGYADGAHLLADEDFASLREDARFRELAGSLKR